MLGPFLLMWVVTVLPIAFVPSWIHPKLKTRQERKTYRAFAYSVLLFTWLTITLVDAWFGNWGGWVWVLTEVFFGSLAYRAIRLRIHLARDQKRVDREFNNLTAEWH